MIDLLRCIMRPSEWSHRNREDADKWIAIEGLLSVAPDMKAAFQSLPSIHDNGKSSELIEASPKGAIWNIPVDGPVSAYMKVTRSNYQNGKRFVVVVSAREFYAFWRAVEILKGSQSQLRPPALDDIPMDRKWKWQAQCWEPGKDNPVPLANIGFHKRHGIGFVDGITRTLWLLYHRAASFPMEVYGRETADKLHEFFGDPAWSVTSVADLLGIEDLPS